MFIRTLLGAFLAAGVTASAANAVTVVNADKTTELFSFMPKYGKAQRVSLRHNHYITLDCKGGGMLSLGKATEACTAKTARIWIKKGKFVI